MTTEPEITLLYHLIGEAVYASQVFEVAFVIAGKLALQQADARLLEDVEPISQSRSFKQASKALLNELNSAQSIDSNLAGRIERLIDDRHRVVHRAFLEFGVPGPLKTEQYAELCRQVTAESQLLLIDLIELVFAWMKRFPTRPEAASAEQQFKLLAATVRQASVAPPGLQGLA
jgi:hypothetical protein